MVLDRKISKFISIAMVTLMGLLCIVSLFEPAFSSDFDDLVKNAEEATSNVSDGLYKVAMTLGPLALIVCLVIILFSHDSRKVSMLIGICVTIIIAWLCIMVVHNGWLKDFLVNLTDKYFGGSGTSTGGNG